MFEPFFTTREVGAGAGLGLASTHGLVLQSGGSLEVESEPGRGACVRLVLPEASLTAPSFAAESPDRKGVAGNETLLVVEDEERLRALVCRDLTQAGYRVLDAPDGRVALEIAASHAGAIDLLVCDVILPGIDGAELAARLQSQRPAMRVLLMSGYAPAVEAEPRRSLPGALFLAKPFRMRDLRAFAREALDAPAEPRPGS
jgi:CheY-like chemotaxis protein